MELNEFNEIFNSFIIYYGEKNMTSEKKSIYYFGLKDLSANELKKGFSEMVRNRIEKEFPTVAEIRRESLIVGEEKCI